MAGDQDKLEIYRDKRGKYRWRRTAPNGSIVGAASSGYERRKDCEANMNRGAVAADSWEFYRDRQGDWRWRRKASNGEIVGSSCEGYRNRKDAESNAARQGWTG